MAVINFILIVVVSKIVLFFFFYVCRKRKLKFRSFDVCT